MTTDISPILDAYALLHVNGRFAPLFARAAYDAAIAGDHTKAAGLLPPPDPSAPVLRARIVALCFAAVAPAFGVTP